MTQQLINIGSSELSGDGESIRSAFQKVNNNFTEIYSGTFVVTESLPTSSTSTGVKGQIATDSTSMYVCVNTNTWIQIVGNTF